MIINFWLLPVALVLLWLPRQWLRFSSRLIPKPKRTREDRIRNARNPGDVSLRFREELLKVRNWLDLVRAGTGAYLVKFVCFTAAADASRDTLTQIFAIQLTIFVVALFIQMIRLEGRFSLAAPIFFSFGLSYALIGLMPTLFACIAVWCINLVLPNPTAFLIVFAGLQGVFGFMLARMSVRDVAVAVGLTMLPVAFSLMTKRRLIQLNKRTKPVIRQRA